mgnify:FL=1
MDINNVLQEGQIVEVDYNKDLVDEYQRNYIMEEEGIGADPDAEPYDTQTKLNEVPLEDMFDEGEVVVEEVITDDTNN